MIVCDSLTQFSFFGLCPLSNSYRTLQFGSWLLCIKAEAESAFFGWGWGGGYECNLDAGQSTNKGECISELFGDVCPPVHRLLHLFSDCEQLMATNSLDHLESC
jgi:hypothetical protein